MNILITGIHGLLGSALFSLYLFYEEIFWIAPVYVSNAEMMISRIMKGDGD